MSDKTKFEVGKLYMCSQWGFTIVKCTEYIDGKNVFSGRVVDSSPASDELHPIGMQSQKWKCENFYEYKPELDSNISYKIPFGYRAEINDGTINFVLSSEYTKSDYKGDYEFCRKNKDGYLYVYVSGDFQKAKIDNLFDKPLKNKTTENMFNNAYNHAIEILTKNNKKNENKI